ncbi:hypothetical protein ACHQM5_026552 [Ranunculus cassubicifolius]
MRTLFRNVRCVKKEKALSKLHELVVEYRFDIIGIAEPMVVPRANTTLVMGLQGYSSNIIHNGANGVLGNLWVLFKPELQPKVISISKQQISVEVEGNLISFIHASSVTQTRRHLWTQLEQIRPNTPWLLGGDFNCVLSYVEKKGGRFPNLQAMQEFFNFVSRCDLLEPASLGSKYSWSNNRKGNPRIVSKIDRFFLQ